MSEQKHARVDRPKILALDLDGTALNYDGDFRGASLGEAVRGMVEELSRLKEQGWVIVIWTCRDDSAELRDHLRRQQIPFDFVNDHPWNTQQSRKIVADVYVDDRGVPFNGIATGLADKILAHRPWWRSSWI